MGNMLCNVECG